MDLNLPACDAEVRQVFHLGEEEILGAAGGVEILRQRHARLPAEEAGHAALIGGDVEGLFRGDGGKEAVQAGKGKAFHAFPPLFKTTEGSQSSLRKSISGGFSSGSAPA